MGWWLLGALPATVALVVLTDVGHAVEFRGAAWEAEGDPHKGDVAHFRLSRTTQRSKPTFYRTGSLSALSRGLMANLSILQEVQEGGTQPHKRDASPTKDACWGCCGAPFPNHTGSREPTRGDLGHLGIPPPPKPPKSNATKGAHRPGAYTPMGKLRRGLLMPAEGRQAESLPGMNGHEAHVTERCRGCCGSNGTADSWPLGRGEQGKESQSSQGNSSPRPWRPVLDKEVPPKRPLQKGENSWPSFAGGANEPRKPHLTT